MVAPQKPRLALSGVYSSAKAQQSPSELAQDSHNLNTPVFFIKIHVLLPEKVMKMSKHPVCLPVLRLGLLV